MLGSMLLLIAPLLAQDVPVPNIAAGLLGGRPSTTGTAGAQAAANGTAGVRRPGSAAPKARVVALGHTDFLRFLHPNAQMAIGMDFQKVFRMAEMMGIAFGERNTNALGAFQEVDHLWLSIGGPRDVVMLMTGHFEKGQVAGMFYSQGSSPVFLGGAQAMLVGPEPSIRAALARLQAPPVADANAGWVAARARGMAASDHELWVVVEPQPPAAVPGAGAGPLAGAREFAFGAKLAGEMSIDGELEAASPERATEISTWVQAMKDGLKLKNGDSALDTLAIDKGGATLRFSAKGSQLANSQALHSEFGPELYSLITARIPGAPARAVAQDKLKAVKAGMPREEALGPAWSPLSVTFGSGLELPRETWLYQAAFGKQVTVRLDGGVVTVAPVL